MRHFKQMRHHTSVGINLHKGIYPELATFVKSFSRSNDEKKITFKTTQESSRKDIEQSPGVLK